MYQAHELSLSELDFWEVEHEKFDSLRVKEDRGEPVYDLEERTSLFGEKIILFAKKVPPTPVNIRLISQLVGAGTSLGANYCGGRRWRVAG